MSSLVPSERARSVAICGCISVGKPGYGRVFIWECLSLWLAETRTASSNSSTVAPISINFTEIAEIKGAGTDKIRITGVRRLHASEYSIITFQVLVNWTASYVTAARQGHLRFAVFAEKCPQQVIGSTYFADGVIIYCHAADGTSVYFYGMRADLDKILTLNIDKTNRLG